VKAFRILLIALLASCTQQPAAGLRLEGRAVQWRYSLPSGQRAQSAALELTNPVSVPGLPGPVDRIELTLSERDHVAWRKHVGRRVEVTCGEPVYAASLWGYPHASCQAVAVRAAP
jgi:hypothetical protein